MTTKDRDAKWKQGQEGAESEGSGTIDRIKFPAPPAGKTSTTILMLTEDNFESCYAVFVDDPEGNRRKIVISVEDWKSSNTDNVLIAEWKRSGDDSLRPSRKYLMTAVEGEMKRFQKKKAGKVVMGEDGKPAIVRRCVLGNVVKLLEVGPRIFQQIASYRNDPDYPAMDEMLFKIERTGSGKNDTSYVVKANDKNVPKMPDDLTEAPNLLDLTKPTSNAEIRKILGLAVAKEDEDTESDVDGDGVDNDDDGVADDGASEEVVEASDDELEELDEL